MAMTNMLGAPTLVVTICHELQESYFPELSQSSANLVFISMVWLLKINSQRTYIHLWLLEYLLGPDERFDLFLPL